MNPLKLEQTSPSVWAITDGSTFGNVGCIRLPQGIVVVDTGMSPHLAQKFRNLIHQQVGTQLIAVVLTHYHSDHVFGTQIFGDCPIIGSTALAALYDAQFKATWSPEGLQELITAYQQMRPELAGQLADLQIIPPTQTFKHSLILGEADEVCIQHTGGHTAGHSTVYFAPERVLFAADLVFCQQYPYAGDDTNDPPQWMQAFQTILAQPVDVIVPGHGPLCTKDEIRLHLAYFQELENWILTQLDQNRSLDEVIQASASSPPFPYKERADARLSSTLKRWYEYYSLKGRAL
ncbi:MAG: MBL fold metallo-hydrolase [Candidatus Hodarchaeota archaeon]